RMEERIHRDDEGKDIDVHPVTEEYREKALEWRTKLIEVVADADDNIATKYLEGEEISGDELEAGVRAAVLEAKLFPVMAGSSLKNKGVQAMLDNVCKYLPSPLDKYNTYENPETHDE